MRSVHRAPMLALGLVLTVAVGACSAGAAPTTGPTVAGATQGPATQQPGASSVATTAPTLAGAAGAAQVDLIFSGTRAITARGTAGRCIVITRADGSVAFGFEATEANYPGLGLGFSLANLTGNFVDIKWLIEATIAYGDSGSGITLSPDHHAVQLDVELAPFTVQGSPTPGPEHVKGTITCP